MTPKELIVNFIEKLDNEKWKGIIPNYNAIDEWVDEYLMSLEQDYSISILARKDIEDND